MSLRARFEEARAGWVPPASPRPRGIVMCAGGARLLANAYVALRRLRELTDLPVELFHAGAAEMPAAFPRELDVPGVTVVELSADLRGFQIKPHALLAASFAEVLLLDADNLPLGPLEPLFETSRGARFWPDLPEARWTQDSLYAELELDPALNRSTPEFESGQLVVDRRRCWQALAAAAWLSSAAIRPLVYPRVNGDKDLFRLAFLLTATPFELVSHAPRRFGAPFFIWAVPGTQIVIKLDHPRGSFYATGLLQHGPDGRPLFAHKTVVEWKAWLDCVAMTHLEGAPAPELAAWERWGQGQLERFRRRYRRLFRPDRGEQLQVIARTIARCGATLMASPWGGTGSSAGWGARTRPGS